jgi:hypothetical protein
MGLIQMARKVVPRVGQVARVLIISNITVGSVLAQSSPMSVMAFDGIYKGSSQRTAGSDMSCAPARRIEVEVRDGRFKLPWREPSSFNVRIYPDGQFYATSGALSAQAAEKRMMIVPVLQGRVTQAGLTANYGTRICRYTLEATRS